MIVGILMALNTYNGPILWVLFLLQHLRATGQGFPADVYRSVSFFRGCELLLFGLVCLVSRYHLFVWTVFSPKLLYEAMETLVITMMAFLICVLNFVFSLKYKAD